MKEIKKNGFIVVLGILLGLLFVACRMSVSETSAQTPVITSISADIQTVVNVPKKLSVGIEISDSGEISYQWYSAESKLAAGTVIENATLAEFIPETLMCGTFYYYCVIENKLGRSTRSVTSPRITYVVTKSVDACTPKIAMQPKNFSEDFGSLIELDVIAYTLDDGELSYQWYFYADGDENTLELEDAVNSSLALTVQSDTLGWYDCVITNTIKDNGDGGKKTASIHTNKVIVSNNIINAEIPVILSEPSDATVLIPAVRDFTVSAYTEDDGVLSYQWYSVSENSYEGSMIEGATEKTYRIIAQEIGKTGYYCVITNTIEDNGDGGLKIAQIQTETVFIDAVYLKEVISAPEFTTQPDSMSIAPYNQSVKLFCKAEALDDDISYRWYKSNDGTTENGVAIIGANSSELETPVFAEVGIYYFYCVATRIISSDKYDTKSAAAISDVVTVAYTGLPTLYLDLNTPLASVTKTSYVQGEMHIISKDYDFSYTFEKEKEGVKGRGNTSWGQPKKPYSIKFDKKQSLFGLPKAKKWCIIANYSDKTLLRNKFASVIGTTVLNTEWNPSFVSVDVVVNGEYRGNYLLGERISLTDNRVEVQDISDVDEYLEAGNLSKIDDANGDGEKDLLDGGFIVEVEGNEARAKAESFYFKGTKGGRSFVLKDPDEVSESVLERIKDVVLNAESVLYSDDFKDEQSGYVKYLDVDSFIDWYLVNELTKNNDAIFYSSVYIYYNPADGKLHMGPNWDFDISCGNINYNGCDASSGWRIKNSVWISRLFSDPAFVEKVKARWNEVSSSLSVLINSSGSTGGIQALADEISVSAEYNFLKWKILGIYVWPNAAGYEERITYQSEVDYMIDWLNARLAWMDTAINAL